MKRPYKLLMSGLGNLYIAKETAKPDVMSSDRFRVSDNEFLRIVELYAKAKIEKGHNTLVVTASGKIVMEITLIDPATSYQTPAPDTTPQSSLPSQD